MTKILDGKIAAQAIKEELKEKYLSFKEKLKLVIIHSNKPDSASYLNARKKFFKEFNAELEEILISNETKKEELYAILDNVNQDYSVDGIMLDRPLPSSFHEQDFLSYISPQKDVDGYTYTNLGKLMSNQPCLNACTAMAAISLVEYYNIPLEGKNVLIIGRSVNVGKPLALLLLNKNATVTIAHSKTKDLIKIAKKADIIFTCVGKANFITKDFVTKKTILVDIGINFDENHKLCGDVSKECYPLVQAYSPVPGGVGVLTNLMLMKNLYDAHQNGVIQNEQNSL